MSKVKHSSNKAAIKQRSRKDDWIDMPNVPGDTEKEIPGATNGRQNVRQKSEAKSKSVAKEKRAGSELKGPEEAQGPTKGSSEHEIIQESENRRSNKDKPPPWKKNDSTEVDLGQEKSGRKLQGLEAEDLNMDQVDYSGTITSGIPGRDADTRSVWSQISYYMVKDFRYYFQHPYSRIFIAYFVVVCNFLIFAEDPVAHSRKECNIPVVGNDYAFVIAFYPPNAWSVLKVSLWFLAIIIGMLIGKFVFHKILFGRTMRLRMFHDDQGSWMLMFLTVVVVLFLFSFILNLIYRAGGDALLPYKVTSLMDIENQTFMKAAACGTWMGDFVTAWMVTDMMLQDKLYPNWCTRLRSFWARGYNRIILFWIVWISMTLTVIMVITTDWINWDDVNNDIIVSNEVSRAFLASFILVMDLVIVMQDWDFPHFESNIDVKLPGLNTAGIDIRLPACLRRESWNVHITGKWFNYGIILMVMILDLNMWKNQIFYLPYDYGQYIDHDSKVWTVTDYPSLEFHNDTIMTYDWRRVHINPLTNMTYASDDFSTNSRFYEYPLPIKATAFIPSISAFVVFGILIWWYGRYAPDPNNPHKGRLFKRKKMRRKDEQVQLTNVTHFDDVDGHKVKGHVNDVAMEKVSGV